MEGVAQDPGFVLDEASGLYYHPSSGFYHDANAGWYYSTKDGVYYRFEEGAYIPIAAKANAESEDPDSNASHLGVESESSNLGDGLKESQLELEDSGPFKPNGQLTHDSTLETRSEEGVHVSEGNDLPETGLGTADKLSSLEVGFPLWHYDSLRSIYWYYDEQTMAYYQYHEEGHNTLNGIANGRESLDDPGASLQGQIAMNGIESFEDSNASNGEVQGHSLQEEQGQIVEDDDKFKPKSGWVEEALIELYLKGYPNDSAEKDDGPLITSADIFSDDPPGARSHEETGLGYSTHDGGAMMVNDRLSMAGFICDPYAVQPLPYESDNEGSEELEEGEWVPDEPLRIVDGDLSSLYDGQGYEEFYDGQRYGESTNEETLQPMLASGQDGGMEAYNDGLEEGEVEDGEIVPDSEDTLEDMGGEVVMAEQENAYSDGDDRRTAEEQWQAQFGQVVREKPKERVVPGAIDLWDWMMVEMEPNTQKPGKVVKKLVGRIASSVTKLVSVSSGLIRTSAIRATELDYVKVSSGKVYRLRRPSIKHLNSQGTYDSSNPTKDWGFPVIGLSLPDASDDLLLHEEVGTAKPNQRRMDVLVSKPFVPNTDHWQFQRLAANSKKSRGVSVPAALLASKHLSSEEMLLNEQRKQKYRDRAAERRTLHGGFGTGPGQKGLTAHEQEKLDAETAVGMEGALKSATWAPPLGAENVGKRMLKGMGWKEGQTLGVEGGLAAPLVAQGNSGRTGLGFS